MNETNDKTPTPQTGCRLRDFAEIGGRCRCPACEANWQVLAGAVRTMRVSAQSEFRSGVNDLIAQIQRFADAAEGAIGEISVDEAWAGVQRTCDDAIRSHR